MRPIAPPHVRDRAGDQLLEHRPIEVGQPLEVQTGLAHPVRAEPGQQGLLLVLLRYQVDHQLATTDCEARQWSLPSVSALVGVPVGAEADDGGSPHPGRLLRGLLQESYQLPAVGALLLAAA